MKKTILTKTFRRRISEGNLQTFKLYNKPHLLGEALMKATGTAMSIAFRFKLLESED